MSSKFKVLSIALVAVLALFGATAYADVTGSFSTSVKVVPQETQSQVQKLDFDIENALDVTVAISGLASTLHTHFGLAGMEDVILTTDATLGALDITSELVFGRFAGVCASAAGEVCYVVSNNTVPLGDDLLFVKKRVTSSISLGGVTFTNLAMFEDVNFPETLTTTTYPEPGVQTPSFAFGDVITLEGQTPSGITISASTGICAEQSPNVIKKHAFDYKVNKECAGEIKPDLMFDFETISISGVPIAPGVTADSLVNCQKVSACELTQTLTFAGGPIPFEAAIEFEDLLTLNFTGATLTFSTGVGELEVEFDKAGNISIVSLDISATLNPDKQPATLDVAGTFAPGEGLKSADVDLTVERAGLTFFANTDFRGGPPDATFDNVTFGVETTAGIIEIETSATFSLTGMDEANATFTINF